MAHKTRTMNRSQWAVGMTLIELLMMVFILGSLVAVAVPNYRRAIEQVYFREARGLLLTIYSGQRAYFFLNDFYFNINNPTDMSQWRMIHMDNPNVTTSLPVTFTASAAGAGSAATFTATARRNGGPCDTLAQTVNEQKTLGGLWGSCSAL